MTARRLVAALAIGLGVALAPGSALSASAAPRAFSNWRATGGQLFRAYSDALMAKDMPALRAVLAPSFVLQRGNGQWATRSRYLANLPTLVSYTLSEVHSVRARGSITMRAITTSDLMVDGVQFRGSPAPMLAVFNWDSGRWRLVAQANFNVPR